MSGPIARPWRLGTCDDYLGAVIAHPENRLAREYLRACDAKTVMLGVAMTSGTWEQVRRWEEASGVETGHWTYDQALVPVSYEGDNACHLGLCFLNPSRIFNGLFNLAVDAALGPDERRPTIFDRANWAPPPFRWDQWQDQRAADSTR